MPPFKITNILWRKSPDREENVYYKDKSVTWRERVLVVDCLRGT
jgi:hypothetical protein